MCSSKLKNLYGDKTAEEVLSGSVPVPEPFTTVSPAVVGWLCVWGGSSRGQAGDKLAVCNVVSVIALHLRGCVATSQPA